MQQERSGFEKEKGDSSEHLIRRKGGDEMRGPRREAILTFRFSAFLALKPCKRRIFPLLPALNLVLARLGASVARVGIRREPQMGPIHKREKMADVVREDHVTLPSTPNQ